MHVVGEGQHDPKVSAQRVMAFAKDMQRTARRVLMPHTGEPLCIRVGIHTVRLRWVVLTGVGSSPRTRSLSRRYSRSWTASAPAEIKDNR